MKKFQKFLQENSVLLVLLLILLVCLGAISTVVVTYFVGDFNSKYGDRLENIEKYPFSEDMQKEIIEKLKAEEKIEEAKIRLSGKIVYITIKFNSGVTLVEAESKALSSLEYFSEDILSFYDLEFMIKADSTEKTDGFQIMGSKNANGTGNIVWNNNTQVGEK